MIFFKGGDHDCSSKGILGISIAPGDAKLLILVRYFMHSVYLYNDLLLRLRSLIYNWYYKIIFNSKFLKTQCCNFVSN